MYEVSRTGKLPVLKISPIGLQLKTMATLLLLTPLAITWVIVKKSLLLNTLKNIGLSFF